MQNLQELEDAINWLPDAIDYAIKTKSERIYKCNNTISFVLIINGQYAKDFTCICIACPKFYLCEEEKSQFQFYIDLLEAKTSQSITDWSWIVPGDEWNNMQIYPKNDDFQIS